MVFRFFIYWAAASIVLIAGGCSSSTSSRSVDEAQPQDSNVATDDAHQDFSTGQSGQVITGTKLAQDSIVSAVLQDKFIVPFLINKRRARSIAAHTSVYLRDGLGKNFELFSSKPTLTTSPTDVQFDLPASATGAMQILVKDTVRELSKIIPIDGTQNPSSGSGNSGGTGGSYLIWLSQLQPGYLQEAAQPVNNFLEMMSSLCAAEAKEIQRETGRGVSFDSMPLLGESWMAIRGRQLFHVSRVATVLRFDSSGSIGETDGTYFEGTSNTVVKRPPNAIGSEISSPQIQVLLGRPTADCSGFTNFSGVAAVATSYTNVQHPSIFKPNGTLGCGSLANPQPGDVYYLACAAGYTP